MGKFILMQTCESEIISVGFRGGTTLYIILIGGGVWEGQGAWKGKVNGKARGEARECWGLYRGWMLTREDDE